MFFALAPMSRVIALVTVFVWMLPAFFLWVGITQPFPPMTWTALGLIAMFAAVWLWWRPKGFHVDARGLRITFPMREIKVPRSQIVACARVERGEFKKRFGWAVRVGVGGLWGGFGWLFTKAGWVEFYVSRMDGFVLVERKDASPLLFSPVDPDKLVDALK